LSLGTTKEEVAMTIFKGFVDLCDNTLK